MPRPKKPHKPIPGLEDQSAAAAGSIGDSGIETRVEDALPGKEHGNPVEGEN